MKNALPRLLLENLTLYENRILRLQFDTKLKTITLLRMAFQNLIPTIEMIIRSNTGQRFEYVSGCLLYGDYLQCTAVSHFTIVRYELSFHSGGFLRVTIHPNLGNDCIKCW